MLKSLDIEPTTICNLACPFCFGPHVNFKEVSLDIEIWFSALENFRKMGVENVIFSGGEPLLYKKIIELVKHAKQLGYNIVISTHGRLKEKTFEVAEYCDWISMPIDGVSYETILNMRTDETQNAHIIDMAKELKKTFGHIKIKIGTVATKKNIHEIIDIGKLLENNIDYFNTWKIYQYTPRRKFKSNNELLSVSNVDFNLLQNKISGIFPKNMRIVYSSNKSRSNAYTFIYQNGDVNLVNIGKDFDDMKVGNICHFNDINFELIKQKLNDNHSLNYCNTY